MQVEILLLSELNQSQKDKYPECSLIVTSRLLYKNLKSCMCT